MAPKLSAIVAVEKGVKQRANKNLGEAHKTLQKVDLFMGLQRDYSPLDDEDTEKLPSESQKIIARVDELMEASARQFAELWNVTATKDFGNTEVTGTVEIDGEVLVQDAPVPFLLFMEAQLRDVVTIIKDIPVLDPSQEWEEDPNTDAWRSKAEETTRTKKIMKSQVLYEATPDHPAQVQAFTEDVVVGKWSRIRFSSAIPAATKKLLVQRAERVLDAVKAAREEANAKEIEQKKIAAPVLNWILEPLQVSIQD